MMGNVRRHHKRKPIPTSREAHARAKRCLAKLEHFPAKCVRTGTGSKEIGSIEGEDQREKWGDLTDDDLDKIAGRRDQLEGKIQERYGLTELAQNDSERLRVAAPVCSVEPT
jgi:CsbD-like